MHLRVHAVLVSLLAVAAYGQPAARNSAELGRIAAPASSPKRWADAREYELGRRASEEQKADEQVRALLEWETAYPKSEFERERSASLVYAYKQAGRPAEAFARATQFSKLHPKEMAGSLMIAGLAPLLPSPSAGQIEITKEAASYLLVRASEAGRGGAAIAQAGKDNTPGYASDPETERVFAMIREWRRGKHIRTAADVESEVRQVAEKALEWVKSFSR